MRKHPLKILILGAKGRLAAALARRWSNSHDVVKLARPELDVSDVAALAGIVAQYDFDILINGTAMTDVDRCEVNRGEAENINVHAPQIMAAVANKKGARLIHFSTDYVFDGKQARPYCEEDNAAPLSWYGQTKLAGEEAVLLENPHHLVVRTSWVFGPDKPSFVDMILDRARTDAQVEAIGDKFSSPTFSNDMANWLEPFFEPSLPGGIFHACNAGGCSWREYGEFALQCAAQSGLPLMTTEVASLRLAEMKQFVAQRPVHTILSTAKLSRVTGVTPRSWQEAVAQYIHEKYASILSPA